MSLSKLSCIPDQETWMNVDQDILTINKWGQLTAVLDKDGEFVAYEQLLTVIIVSDIADIYQSPLYSARVNMSSPTSIADPAQK